VIYKPEIKTDLKCLTLEIGDEIPIDTKENTLVYLYKGTGKINEILLNERESFELNCTEKCKFLATLKCILVIVNWGK
jgi:hypothetical protein